MTERSVHSTVPGTATGEAGETTVAPVVRPASPEARNDSLQAKIATIVARRLDTLSSRTVRVHGTGRGAVVAALDAADIDTGPAHAAGEAESEVTPADLVVVAPTGQGVRADELEEAYRLLRANGRLVVALAGPLETPPALRGRSRSSRDLLSTELFAAGFVEFEFSALDAGGGLIIEAARPAAAPPLSRRQVLSVVVPVYNEASTVAEVLDLLLSKRIDGIDLEVIVVESNSSDGSRQVVQRYMDHPNVQLILEDRAQGKGHAVRAGLRAATGDFVLIQDADLEYDLSDYERLLEPLRRLEASFVLGVRQRTDGARFGVRHFEKQVVVSRLINVGNVLFLTLFNLVYRERLQDPFTMFKVVRRDTLHKMRLECDRFDFDWELMAKLLRRGFRPVELPVSYHSRSFSEGKKISVLGDPWSWVVACFRYRFSPLE
ncbi:MAG: glycosyl transferase, family 2 [Acidimicrobiaceae bacterium]|nr:glycosyl transferase, family 2 [Acidimicrobiaceae bacterium]